MPEGILVTAEKPDDSQSSGASSSGGPRTLEFLDAGIRASEWLQEGGTWGFTGGLALTVAGGSSFTHRRWSLIRRSNDGGWHLNDDL